MIVKGKGDMISNDTNVSMYYVFIIFEDELIKNLGTQVSQGTNITANSVFDRIYAIMNDFFMRDKLNVLIQSQFDVLDKAVKVFE